PRGHDDVGAVAREQQREMAAEPARRAGHQRDAAAQDVTGKEAHSDLALSRSTNFWILPVAVLGSGPNTIALGALKCAMRSRHHATTSGLATTGGSGFSVTNAQGVSPHLSSGRATTAASITCGCRYRHSSTSSELTFSP